MIVKARYDGRVFVPEAPVDLPPGSEVEISIPAEAPRPATQGAAGSTPPLVALIEMLDRFPDDPDRPEDGATQHDHYLYGTPKRENP